MSTTQYKTTRGHEPLRVPAGWKDQDRALIIQLERILDDIYKHFQKLRKSDLSQELLDLLAEYDQAVEDVEDILEEIGDTPMGTTATTLTGAIAEHESDISDISSELSALYGLTVTQLKGK